MKKLLSGLAGLLLIGTMSFLIGCGGRQVSDEIITVGCKNFTEQYIIGEMITQLLAARGFDVKLISGLTSEELREKLESGEVDICADYTGTAWILYFQKTYLPGTPARLLYTMVKERDRLNGLVWLDPIWNDNTYVLVSWPDLPDREGLKTLTDLAEFYRKKEGKVSTFIDHEFSRRPDGLPALQKTYTFHVDERFLWIGPPGQSIKRLKDHEARVAMVFATDPAIGNNDWFIYQDEQMFFPPYDLAFCLREELLKDSPRLKAVLGQLSNSFPSNPGEPTPETIAACRKVWQNLNSEVDIEQKDPARVAADYLRRKGLI